MESFYKIIIIAIIGGLIGWITNLIAIKMLFKPVNPIKILFFTLQGVFPKRQREMAKSLGKIIENELVNVEDFKESLFNEKNMDKIKQKISVKLDETIKNNIPPMFLAMAGGQINAVIENFVNNNNDFFKDLINDVVNSESIEVSRIVEEKVNKMDFAQFEKILLDLINKELKYIEYIGGLLGFIIGIFQGLIFQFA